MNHDDPFYIDGTFFSTDSYIGVELQTNNPTSQTGRKGQLFVQRHNLYQIPLNKAIANMLRNLADSVEFQWENLDKNSNL